MAKISEIKAREVLDSRGNPTVEVEMGLDSGHWALAIVPSGASTGEYEACELRDKDPMRYQGKGVQKAIHVVNDNIQKSVLSFESGQQRKLDKTLVDLDGTENKTKLGANAILAVSMAYAKVSAAAQDQTLFEYFAALSGQAGVTLPVPMMNVLNGGVHADNNLDLQEFMIMPVGFARFSEALRAGVEVFHCLKQVLKEKKLSIAVGDEGGFTPNLKSNDEALEYLCLAVKNAGYEVGKHIVFAIDSAASEFYEDGIYLLENDKNPRKTSLQMVDYYAVLKEKFPIVSIEDGLDQNDWDGWKALTERLGKGVQLVGDDLFVTNTRLLSKGISQHVANAVLIKPNQIGTLTETLDCIAMAKKAGYRTVISHRSGESEDVTIADLAVGTEAGQIKTGSLCRTDRVAKYNQLLRIEEKLGSKAKYPGTSLFAV